MVVIQENKTYSVKSRLHLPHGEWEEERKGYFLSNKLRKYNLG